MIDETHDLQATSWLADAQGHAQFPVQNLPLGIFSTRIEPRHRGGIAIGDHVIDLSRLAPLFTGDARTAADAASGTTLNALLALGAAPRRALRRAAFKLLTDSSTQAVVREALLPAADCTLHMPASVGDYTDFYTGIHHAENIGRLLRPDAPLLPNYKYVPIGYHGRSSSIDVSGAAVIRPKSQTKAPDDVAPAYRASQRLDYETEMGLWIGGSNRRGEPVPIANAGEFIAGVCLLNDWSARDVQAWEYQPLGPFLAKNFLTTISPWIVTTEALAPYRIAQPARPQGDPSPLPYLYSEEDQAAGAFSITVEVTLRTRQMRVVNAPAHKLSRVDMRVMYWTAAQLVTHHTCNGCNLMPGDLLGTGTLSGPDPASFGSFMELSQAGRKPLQLPNGEQRSFLQDGDELTLSAHADIPGRVRIGFGTCVGTIADTPLD